MRNFPTILQEIQHLDKYSRYDWEKGRRETWPETVARAASYLEELSEGKLSQQEYARIKDGILNLDVLPSMRLMAMAGKAARRNNISVYNCSYLPIDSTESFVEILTILISGTGVGYSVERRYTDLLPTVREPVGGLKPIEYVVADSSEGWARALRFALDSWFIGHFNVTFNYESIRPAGTPLKTKGGTASGHKPLKRLLEHAEKTIYNAAGRKLTPLECHDIACYVGNCIVQGGVRRSALISLFDDGDREMIACKDWPNIEGNEQRWIANNSAVWNGMRTFQQIETQMASMHEGGNGEPGIFSRLAAKRTMPERRDTAHEFGTNPCGEIVLRPRQFCNLSAAVARSEDTLARLVDKVELATIIGTIQSMATDFKGLPAVWKKNCEEERLLGVDITGQMDSELARDATVQAILKEVAVSTNARIARVLGINQSASVTCVKPSGNTSVLVDCSPGIHPRHAPYYIRRLRFNAENPLAKLLKASGFELTPENGQTWEDATTVVASFPVKSPETARVVGEDSALEQLDYWLSVKANWCEHNPSATIYYEPEELDDVTEWVFRNQEMVGGLSFLPRTNAQYAQMPMEEIPEDDYEALSRQLPEVNWDLLEILEDTDMTLASQELACFAGACLI